MSRFVRHALRARLLEGGQEAVISRLAGRNRRIHTAVRVSAAAGT